MAKAARFELRADQEQLDLWRIAAEADGRSLGDWLARVADHAASTELKILKPSKAQVFYIIERSEHEEIERICLALRYAIEASAGKTSTVSPMVALVRRLESEKPIHPSTKTRHILDPDEQAIVRRAQIMVATKAK